MVAYILKRPGAHGEVRRADGLAGELGARSPASPDLAPGAKRVALAQKKRPQPAAGQPPGHLKCQERQMGDQSPA